MSTDSPKRATFLPLKPAKILELFKLGEGLPPKLGIRTSELLSGFYSFLGFTRLTSLIDGVAGVATVQVGNLVSSSSGPVTSVSTLNPIRDNFTVSEQEYLSLARADAFHRLEVKLILADGSVYEKPGRFWFANRQVDQNTGAIQLTSLFPNPRKRLVN